MAFKRCRQNTSNVGQTIHKLLALCINIVFKTKQASSTKWFSIQDWTFSRIRVQLPDFINARQLSEVLWCTTKLSAGIITTSNRQDTCTRKTESVCRTAHCNWRSSGANHTKCRQTPRATYGETSAVIADDTKLTPWLSSNATPLMCSTWHPGVSTTQFRSRSKPASADSTRCKVTSH